MAELRRIRDEVAATRQATLNGAAQDGAAMDEDMGMGAGIPPTMLGAGLDPSDGYGMQAFNYDQY